MEGRMKKTAKVVRKPKIRVVLGTAPAKEAVLIARMVLDERLIACANLISGVRSLYRWKGKVCDDAETVMVMKTPEANVAKLLKRLKALHSYDVPEFLVLSVEAGSGEYVEWVMGEGKGN